MADDERLATIISFLQQQGFVWGPEPEIYGGAAGFFTYGPTGTLLKRRVEQMIRRVFARHQFFEVETPTILPRTVWEASGHLSGFTDPLIQDAKGNVYRADKLVEDYFQEKGIKDSVPVKEKAILSAIDKYGIKSPAGERLKTEITFHSLMMRTNIGTDTEAYCRPETATATYLPFLRYVEFFRKRLPFGVYQIGKAYRNEISPRQHVLRMREFTQAEAQLFINPKRKDGYPGFRLVHDKSFPVLSWGSQQKGEAAAMMSVADAREKFLGSDAYAYTLYVAYELFTSFGIPVEKLRLRQHGPDEKAFYAADAWDVEINLPTFGWYEVCGVHDRTDYDLSQHAKFSKKELSVFVEGDNERVVPHVLEIAFGVDRPVFALLDLFYTELGKEEGKSMFKVPYGLAPIPVSVFPLVKKVNEKALEVFRIVQDSGIVCTFDDSGSIGKRYLRAAVIGTPFCVTIDFETLDDNTVTVRDRDTEKQDRVKISELVNVLRSRLAS